MEVLLLRSPDDDVRLLHREVTSFARAATAALRVLVLGEVDPVKRATEPQRSLSLHVVSSRGAWDPRAATFPFPPGGKWNAKLPLLDSQR